MKTSPNGLNFIKQFEGFRQFVYPDVAGKMTIGYGHLLTEGEQFPNGITEAQGLDLLAQDLSGAEDSVSRFASQANQNQFDALVDFTFNLGAGSLQEMLSHGWDEVPVQMVRWDHAGGKQVAGLTARREKEVELFTS